MGVVTALVVAGVAAAGATAAAIAKKKAAEKAATAQKKGISQQEELLRKKLDPGALNRLAQATDRERALGRIQLQKEVDPAIADLREFSANKLDEIAKRDQGSLQSQQVANQLFNENITADPKMEKLKDTIIGRAQQDFDAGATLPPEFQAELVRTGLQTGAQAGIGTARTSVGGVTSRLLGSAGIQLAQQRAQEGAQLAGTADALARSRQQLLANIFPTVKVQEDAETQRAALGFQLGDSTLPESGLSGNDAVNIEIARRKGQAGLLGQRAAVRAGQAQANGEFTAGLIGAGTSLATGAVGGISGALAPSAGAGVSGINYGSLAQNVVGSGGSAGGFSNNPYFGQTPGAVPYGYQGDPSLLVGTRRI